MALLFPPPYPKVCVSPARKRRLKRQEWNIFHDRNVRHAPCFRGSDGNVHHSVSLGRLLNPPPKLTHQPPPSASKAQEETEREREDDEASDMRSQQGRVILCDTPSLVSSEVSLCAEVAEAGRKWLRMDEGVGTHYAPPDASEWCRQARARLVFPVVRDAAAPGHELPFNQTLSFLLTLPSVSAVWHIVKL